LSAHHSPALVVVLEDEAGTGAVGRIPVLDGVGQATRFANQGRSAVGEAVHLVEAAGLITGGHQEHVDAGFDPMGERLVERRYEPGLFGEAIHQ
jgi:hypothetical protein